MVVAFRRAPGGLLSDGPRYGCETRSTNSHGSPASGRDTKSSALDDESLLQQDLANAVAEISLELDRAVLRGPAGAACAFELLTERLQKGGIAWKTVHDGHGFPAAPLFLDAQLGDDLRRNPVVVRRFAAPAVVGRPAAARADTSGARRVDKSTIRHRAIMPCGSLMRQDDVDSTGASSVSAPPEARE